MSAFLEAWIMGLGKEGWRRDLCDPLGLGSWRKGGPQQVSCYRAGVETGGVDLGIRYQASTLKTSM